MSAMLNYLRQFIQNLSTEQPRISDIEISYLGSYPNLVCVIEDDGSVDHVFIKPDVFDCFMYVYPNRFCSLAQFIDFGNIINTYLVNQMNTDGLFNNFNQQGMNGTQIFQVSWYFIAVLPPAFGMPEQQNMDEETNDDQDI